MRSELWGIPDFEVFGFLALLLLFWGLELIGGILESSRRSGDDWWLEVLSFTVPPALIKPGIVAVSFVLGNLLFPSWHNALAGWNMWALLPIYLLIDDFAQYWYHRTAHEVPWLWKLHRPHHTARELGLLAMFRNGAFYYVFLPNLWLIGLGTFLGAINTVAVGIVLKQIFVVSSHSPTRWDRFLYRTPALHPLAWLIERTFITPAVHYAHHGCSEADGISNPHGNYGNMFFIWDQLFGTALITRQYPRELGLIDDPGDPWWAQFFYPLLRSNRPGSEIAPRSTKKHLPDGRPR